MSQRNLNDISAISFDIGGTLIEPFVIPVFEVHKKFIHQVCGDNYSFTNEEIAEAIDTAEEEIWKLVPQPDIHYFFSEEDWYISNQSNRVLCMWTYE